MIGTDTICTGCGVDFGSAVSLNDHFDLSGCSVPDDVSDQSTTMVAAKMTRYQRRKLAGDPHLKGKNSKGGPKGASSKSGPSGRRLPRTLFHGCDGEGFTDALGVHRYYLLRVGDTELYTGKPLTSWDCLAFLCGLDVVGNLGNSRWHLSDTDQHGRPVLRDCRPGQAVGFSFNYDVTMILRDLDPTDMDSLIREGSVLVTDPHNDDHYYIEWIPGKIFTVHDDIPEKGERKFKLHDVFGWFQGSFHSAITSWSIGTQEQRDRIESMKGQRSTFSHDEIDEVRAYCGEECALLADLMILIRDTCHKLGYSPRGWYGSGVLSEAMLRKHKVNRYLPAVPMPAEYLLGEDKWKRVSRREQCRLAGLPKGWCGEPPAMADPLRRSFFGGRFEIARQGWVPAVAEDDLNSAYPSVTVNLPCLAHGEWVRRDTMPSDGSRALCHVRWNLPRPNIRDPRAVPFAPFPWRDKDDQVWYPLEGRGWYWDREVTTALEVFIPRIVADTCVDPEWFADRVGIPVKDGGFGIEIEECWVWRQSCTHHPFDWVAPRYEERQILDSMGDGRGKILKLGLNGVYGKTAQTVGAQRFLGPAWAAIITSDTRARLLGAAGAAGMQTVALATDAIYTSADTMVDADDWASDAEGWERELPPHYCQMKPLSLGAQPGKPLGGWARDRKVPCSLLGCATGTCVAWDKCTMPDTCPNKGWYFFMQSGVGWDEQRGGRMKTATRTRGISVRALSAKHADVREAVIRRRDQLRRRLDDVVGDRITILEQQRKEAVTMAEKRTIGGAIKAVKAEVRPITSELEGIREFLAIPTMAEGTTAYDRIEAWWRWYNPLDHPLGSSGGVPIADTRLIGVRTAHAWGQPELAGQWITMVREASFNVRPRREEAGEVFRFREGEVVRTVISLPVSRVPGTEIGELSHTYQRLTTPEEMEEMLAGEQPEPVDEGDLGHAF